jgi:hypothetical protein
MLEMRKVKNRDWRGEHRFSPLRTTRLSNAQGDGTGLRSDHVAWPYSPCWRPPNTIVRWEVMHSVTRQRRLQGGGTMSAVRWTSSYQF